MNVMDLVEKKLKSVDKKIVRQANKDDGEVDLELQGWSDALSWVLWLLGKTEGKRKAK